jgi:hypothetical protein
MFWRWSRGGAGRRRNEPSTTLRGVAPASGAAGLAGGALAYAVTRAPGISQIGTGSGCSTPSCPADRGRRASEVAALRHRCDRTRTRCRSAETTQPPGTRSAPESSPTPAGWCSSPATHAADARDRGHKGMPVGAGQFMTSSPNRMKSSLCRVTSSRIWMKSCFGGGAEVELGGAGVHQGRKRRGAAPASW